MRRLATGIVVVLCLNAPTMAEMFKIDNPASIIENPAARMNNPNPLAPLAKPVSEPTGTEATTLTNHPKQIQDQTQPKTTIPHKSYHFKTVRAYINSANKAFNQDNYLEFTTITEDALRRINAGTLKASKKTKQKLEQYRALGYGHLKQNDN